MLEIPTFFQHEILVEFRLQQASFICAKMYDVHENFIALIFEKQHFASGKHTLKIFKTNLKKGSYHLKIYIDEDKLFLTQRVTVS